MKKMYLTGTVLFLMAGTPAISTAQNKVEADIGADLVSGYIWRGQDLGNVSVQPSVSLSYKGFSLSGWGSVGFDKEDTKEFDLTLGIAPEDSVYPLLITGSMEVPVIFTTMHTTPHTCLKHKSATTSVHWPSTGTRTSQEQMA